MMKIKYLSIYIISFTILCCTSCRKFLDVNPPENRVSNNDVFSDVNNALTAVLGAYDPLSGDNTYGLKLSVYYPYDTDEGQVSGSDLVDRRSIPRYDLRPGNLELVNPWNSLYQGIDRANICIEQIPLMEKYNNGSAEEKKQLARLHGESLTLRAQYYFELIRNWGDVPSPFIPSYKQKDLFVAKINRDEVYEKLLEDLKLAATLMPWRTQAGTNNERFTKGAAKALRARIALYRGGYSLRKESGMMERKDDFRTYYEIARNECLELIENRNQHTLNPKFEDVFRNICSSIPDPSGEVIFEAAMGGGTANSDSKLGYAIGPSLSGASKYGQGNPLVIALPNYFYEFDSTDKRRDVTITNFQIILGNNVKTPRTLSQITYGKFRRDWVSPAQPGTAQYLGINWPLMRFSDVLLMFAEAENELNNGPGASAIAAFEEVRIRGFGGNKNLIGVTPNNKEDFFRALVHERLLEFGGEGIRKYDLIRWNLLGTKLADTKSYLSTFPSSDTLKYPKVLYWKNDGENLIFLNSFYKPSPLVAPTGASSTLWLGSINEEFIKRIGQEFTPNKSELLPINQPAINTDPNLTQDYGY